MRVVRAAFLAEKVIGLAHGRRQTTDQSHSLASTEKNRDDSLDCGMESGAGGLLSSIGHNRTSEGNHNQGITTVRFSLLTVKYISSNFTFQLNILRILYHSINDMSIKRSLGVT